MQSFEGGVRVYSAGEDVYCTLYTVVIHNEMLLDMKNAILF